MQAAVADKESDALVGDVRCIAWRDSRIPTSWGPRSRLHHRKGYATEATVVVDYLFGSCNAHRVFANTDGRKLGAQRVLQRLGFRHEGTAVDADFFKGEWTDLMTFAVLAHEWPRRSDGSRGA
jgi:RimJ/RimL family protein N-acetyltransferase